MEKPQILSDEEYIRRLLDELVVDMYGQVNQVDVNTEFAKQVIAYYEPLIQQAKAEVAREIIPLVDKLFEALDHADFSNGIEANGIDEGNVRANQHIGELRREYLSFKSKYGGQK